MIRLRSSTNAALASTKCHTIIQACINTRAVLPIPYHRCPAPLSLSPSIPTTRAFSSTRSAAFASKPTTAKAPASAKAPVINIAAKLQFPSPSSKTAPFPASSDANNSRAWQPQLNAKIDPKTTELLTTPIFYVNGKPHIGHLSTTLLLDALARWKNLRDTGDDATGSKKQLAYLTSGTDEHGIKVLEAAFRNGQDAPAFSRDISRTFHDLFSLAHIHVDDYIRTSEQRHFHIAQAVWNELHRKDFIYLGQHEGWYSRVDECFIPANQIETRTTRNPDGTEVETHHDKETGHKLEFQSERNYKFRLSAFRQVLIKWIEASVANTKEEGRSVIEPPSRRNEILSFLRSTPLEDISVSRLKSKVSWGVPLPPPDANTQLKNDETAQEYDSHVMYVWLDALSNYLTVSGITGEQIKDLSKLSSNSPLWPPSVQLIGKDILRFHTIYWPTFLLALNLPSFDACTKSQGEGETFPQIQFTPEQLNQLLLPLPKQVVAHAHWMVDRTKMSKSLGNIIDPVGVINDFGVDATRYFLLRDSQLSMDSNFATLDLVKRLHADLADTLGNLLSRCIGPALLPSNSLPQLDAQALEAHPFSAQEQELINELNSLPAKIDPLFSTLQFGESLQMIFTYLYKVNAFVAEIKPWELWSKVRTLEKQEPVDREAVALVKHTIDKCMYVCLESLRCVAILMQPIMPEAMAKLLWRLGVDESKRSVRHAVCTGKSSNSVVKFPSTLPSSATSESEINASKSVFVLFQKLDPKRVEELVKKYAGNPAAANAATAAISTAATGSTSPVTPKEQKKQPSAPKKDKKQKQAKPEN